MTKQEFFDELAEIMEVDVEITATTNLAAMDEFDSLAVMSLVALINSKFGKLIPGATLQKVQTPAELMTLIGEEKFA